MTERKQPEIGEFVAMGAVLMCVVALSIDIMLPSLGTLAEDLGAADGNRRQWVLTVLLIGLTTGQLFFGPISDAVGRRPAILTGVAGFITGSLICAAATTFEMMLVGRALQGFSAAGPRTVMVALIRDRFEGPTMARVISIIMGIFVLVPVLAPAVGQALLLVMHWRGLFVVLAAVSLTGGLWLLARQPETLLQRRKLGVVQFLRAVGEVLSNRRAVSYTLASACCYGAMMGYIISSQQIFQDLYRVGEAYAVLFGVSAVFISAATLLNARLVKTLSMEGICIWAAALSTLWSVGFLLFVLVAGLPPLWVWMVVNGPILFLLGLPIGNFNAIALQDLGHVAGLAAALVASATTGFSLVISAGIGLLFDMTVVPVVAGYTIFSGAALVLILLGGKRRV